LGCALLGLVAAAALYALTAGEEGCALISARAPFEVGARRYRVRLFGLHRSFRYGSARFGGRLRCTLALHGRGGHTWSIAIVLGLCIALWFAGLRWRYAQGTPRGVGFAVTKVVSAGLVYLPYASLALVAYAVWRTALLSRLDPGAHIDPGHAKWLVVTCVVILVLQSMCLSLIRGADRAGDEPPPF
jgi:hypothetical protein